MTTDLEAVGIVAVIALFLIFIGVVAPLALLWAVYTILGQPMRLDIYTYLAALTLIFLFGFRTSSKSK